MVVLEERQSEQYCSLLPQCVFYACYKCRSGSSNAVFVQAIVIDLVLANAKQSLQNSLGQIQMTFYVTAQKDDATCTHNFQCHWKYFIIRARFLRDSFKRIEALRGYVAETGGRA